MSSEEVILRKEGKVAYLLIHREKALNALNLNVMTRLDQIFSELENDEEVIVIIITGVGSKAFVAGADIKEIKEAGDKRTEFIQRGQEIFFKIRNSSKVVIAAVNGYALGGGCELAMACDIRIASENAKLGFPETTLGLMPGYGGTQFLPRLIGMGKAKHMIFTGESLTAMEAYQFGLVEKVCSRENLMDEIDRIAKKIASNGPFAVKACKRAIHNGMELSLEQALRMEMEEYDRVARSKDAEEGLTSFMEKKPPTFTGR
ncbi:MAG: enoyl-CoA hydratase-related protein [Desulfobacterales bacterium]|nr:enoyl-CoA hydratase-related protein [Desulfobacterales bacterium]